MSIVKSIGWARVRELEVRERIAMIEKGLIPPPESNPRGFEARRMDSMDRSKKRNWDDSPYDRYFIDVTSARSVIGGPASRDRASASA